MAIRGMTTVNPLFVGRQDQSQPTSPTDSKVMSIWERCKDNFRSISEALGKPLACASIVITAIPILVVSLVERIGDAYANYCLQSENKEYIALSKRTSGYNNIANTFRANNRELELFKKLKGLSDDAPELKGISEEKLNDMRNVMKPKSPTSSRRNSPPPRRNQSYGRVLGFGGSNGRTTYLGTGN